MLDQEAKVPRDIFHWRRILNNYGHINVITDEDWKIICDVFAQFLSRNNSKEKLKENSIFLFELFQSLVSSDLSVGKFFDNLPNNLSQPFFKIDYLGNETDIVYSLEMIRDLVSYGNKMMIKDFCFMMVEALEKKVNP